MLQVSIYPLLLFGRGVSDRCVFRNSDSNNARTLNVQTDISYNYQEISIEKCVNKCVTLGHPYAGVEFAVECCTCRLFDELSSPDQSPPLKGVVIISIQAQRYKIKALAAYWLALRTVFSIAVDLTVCSFTPGTARPRLLRRWFRIRS